MSWTVEPQPSLMMIQGRQASCSSGCQWLCNGGMRSPSAALSPPNKRRYGHWLQYNIFCLLVLCWWAKIIIITRKSCTGQVLPSAKYRPTHLVVDAALRPIGKSTHGGHKIPNISVKKVAAAPCSETAWAKKLQKFSETCFVAHCL